MSPSSLPPRLRDTKNLEDLVRQEKVNLRQLGVGFAGGRFPPLRPRSTNLDLLGEDDEVDADDLPAAWNTDVVYATTAGAFPPLNLTYEPIEGTLLIFWDGVYLHPTDYVLAGQRVTFVDRHVHVGHRLMAAYWYWPGDVPVAGPLDSLVLRGVTSATGALPSETQVGDFVVIATRDTTSTYSDPRFPMLSTPGTESRVYAGIATDLSPLVPSGPDGVVVVAAFVGGAVVDAVNFDTDPTTPSVPAQPGTAAIGVVSERSSFVGGSVWLPVPPWTFAVSHVLSPGWGWVAIYYWFNPAADSTPAAAAGSSGGVDETEAFLLTLLGPDQ
jgi:hypothetical protein